MLPFPIVTVTASLVEEHGEQVMSPYQISASPLLPPLFPAPVDTAEFQVVTPPSRSCVGPDLIADSSLFPAGAGYGPMLNLIALAVRNSAALTT